MMNLETNKFHLMSYENEYKLFIYDYLLIRRVNKILKGYDKDVKFKKGDEAVFRFPGAQLENVKKALKVKI